MIEGLDTGSYSVFVRNQLGCLQSDTFELEEPLPIGVDAMTTIAGCDGGRDGSIEVVGKGSYAPFRFDFSDGRGFTDQTVREDLDRKSTRLNSSHVAISYAVFCLKKKKT